MNKNEEAAKFYREQTKKDMDDIIITKKEGEVVLIINEPNLTLRAQINPWTLEADIEYSCSNRDLEAKLLEFYMRLKDKLRAQIINPKDFADYFGIITDKEDKV